mgnify:CR=1 FL=1
MYKMRKETQKCDAVVARDSQVVAPCQHLSYYPFAVARGEGDILTDEDGNEYIDFLTSASSLNLGSSNKIVTHAIQEQLSRYTQYTAAYSYNEPMTSYAEKLTSVYPGGIKAKCVLETAVLTVMTRLSNLPVRLQGGARSLHLLMVIMGIRMVQLL